MKTKVILVNGFPASGKSTLAAKLSQDLSIAMLGKDQLKEFLADSMHVSGESWSAVLGRASNSMLIALLSAAVGKQNILLESAFIAEFARPDISAALENASAEVIEIYCTTDRDERMRRWGQRYGNGTRHAIHTDKEGYGQASEASLMKKYEPLKIGTFLQIDTSSFGDSEYATLLQKVKEFVEV